MRGQRMCGHKIRGQKNIKNLGQKNIKIYSIKAH